MIRLFLSILICILFTPPGLSTAAGKFGSLAVGAPFKSTASLYSSGAVSVILGSADGLSSANNQLWSQDTEGIEGEPEEMDSFGSSLAACDFNNDGYCDLAVGDPGEPNGALITAGAVNIIYGASEGLTSDNNKMWSQDSDGIDGQAEEEDNFGEALAVGDFNNDGFADLAIGVPEESIGTTNMAGAVNILYGSTEGLSSDKNQLWHQNSDGIEGMSEEEDFFGKSLTTGDFNNDGFADLAIGVPGEAIDATTQAGAVNIIYGSATGLTSENNRLWSQNEGDIEDDAEEGDQFGHALTAGDFNNDGFTDLAVGAPFDIVTNTSAVAIGDGKVNIIYGTAAGLGDINNQLWSRNSEGIQGEAEFGDTFGISLAAGDFNNDGFSDLAVGVPGDDVIGPPGSNDNGGSINIIYGGSGGLHNTNNQLWSLDTEGIEGEAEEWDLWGLRLLYIPPDTHILPWPMFLQATTKNTGGPLP